MKTIEVQLYKFDELSEDIQEKVLEKMWNVNVDYEWWEFIYEDAANVNMEIKAFDIGRGSYVQANIPDALETANLILKEHGENCETTKTANNFLIERDNLVAQYSDGINQEVVAEENEAEFDAECDDLEEDFKQSLCEDYRIILSNEYDYLTSEEAIKETIEANDYDFTADGELY